MSVLLRTLGRQADKVAKHREVNEKVMRWAAFDDQIKRDVEIYEEITTAKREKKEVQEKFVGAIGRQLKVKIGWEIVKAVFQKNHVLNNMVIRQPLK